MCGDIDVCLQWLQLFNGIIFQKWYYGMVIWCYKSIHGATKIIHSATKIVHGAN